MCPCDLRIPKYFANQSPARQTQGGKILAGIMILHMVTQPIYDVLLFDLPWKGEFPMHMCDFSMMAMIVYLPQTKCAKNSFFTVLIFGVSAVQPWLWQRQI
jgi:hypothetical protein